VEKIVDQYAWVNGAYGTRSLVPFYRVVQIVNGLNHGEQPATFIMLTSGRTVEVEDVAEANTFVEKYTVWLGERR
jgi:hypothetical protein